MEAKVWAYRLAAALIAIALGTIIAAVITPAWELTLPAVPLGLAGYGAYRYATSSEGGMTALAIANRSRLYKARSFTLGVPEAKRLDAERFATEHGYRLAGEWRVMRAFGRTALSGRFTRPYVQPRPRDVSAAVSDVSEPMPIDFGDEVRIRSTPETMASGHAGKVGKCYGFTTPSVTGVDVIGGAPNDQALAINFGEEPSVWFEPSLVEFVGFDVGQVVKAGAKVLRRDENGEWVEATEPDGGDGSPRDIPEP